MTTLEQTNNDNDDPITVCQVLREQNEALRQELHDIRREMDEITDQFRTEDAEEFKQIQVELEVAAKNCRILQFKLRKSEKRNENTEAEKLALEEKINRMSTNNDRLRELDEELLIAKEVSVRLHNELEKSDESRLNTEKLNNALKQQLDTMKEFLDNKTPEDFHHWQMFVALYESLFREYILTEELTWLNAHRTSTISSTSNDLINSYQQKISILHEEISHLKENLDERDRELTNVKVQCKILKQRSRSVERNSNGNEENSAQRSKRGLSVETGGNLREQLEASTDEIRLLKNKLLRMEDELNSSVLEKESLLAKLEEKNLDSTFDKDLHRLIDEIENLHTLIKANRFDGKIITDLQQMLRSSRWSKDFSDEQQQTRSTLKKNNDHLEDLVERAGQFLKLIQEKEKTFEQIRSRLADLTYETSETRHLFEELEQTKKHFHEKQQMCERLQSRLEQIENCSREVEEERSRNDLLEKNLIEQKLLNQELQQENTRLINLNTKQSQDLKHIDQLRQSILTFEKKLDQKQTRVNELSMRIIEKEDIIETKVRECQKHRLELRELETKYYTLGKQLEEQILAMSKEIEKLNVEKEMLRLDLESLRTTKNPTIDDEFVRMKIECQQRISNGEVETIQLRLKQSNKEKDDLIKKIKDLEKKYKELQLKNDVNEQSWTRLKNETSEKQRKYDESIKLKSELQNAVDRLRQKLHDLETHSQDKQNRYAIEKQQWENQRLEFTGKINELEEQLSKVTKRQRKDLDTNWKKERQELQKQLQQSQQMLKDFQKQMINRDAPMHLNEKINVLMTENELLLNKIKDLENVVEDVQLLKNEMTRLKEKNAADWAHWRQQQSDLYAQLRLEQTNKENLLHFVEKFRSRDDKISERFLRDLSVGPISLNSYSDELPKGKFVDQSQSAEQNVAASIEEIATKIDRVEDHLFSYRRFMDFIRAKSEKSSSVARDESFSSLSQQTQPTNLNKRLASAPPENHPENGHRRSRLDTNTSDEIPIETPSPVVSSSSTTKNRFFSLSRRFRFRTQSPESSPTVHFLDQDIDLETKERTTRKSEQSKPSKGILKSLRHRSPFRFRSKDAVIVEKEVSPTPPPPPPTPAAPPPAVEKAKVVATSTPTKSRGRLVELKKVTTKPNGTSKKIVNVTPIIDPTIARRGSGLKDLIHKFDAPPVKPKRLTDDEPNVEETIRTQTIDIPDLLQNVDKDTSMNLTKPILRHSNSSRQTSSFDSSISMVSASDSILTTSSSTRKPTSTARPLMLSVVNDSIE